VNGAFFDAQGRQLATSSDRGEVIHIWSLEHDPPKLIRTLSGGGGLELRFDPSGSMLAGRDGSLWDLTARPEAEPLRLQSAGWGRAFDPEGRWLATRTMAGDGGVALWPLARLYPQILTGHGEGVKQVQFTPDGRRLVSTAEDGSVRLWPLGGGPGERSRVLLQTEGWMNAWWEMAMAADGSFVALGNNSAQVVVLPLDGGPPRELSGFTDNITAVAVGPESRLVAAGSGRSDPEETLVRVWDLNTGEMRILDAGDGKDIVWLRFTGEGELLVRSSHGVIRRWDLAGAVPRVVDEIDLSRWELEGGAQVEDFSPDGREILLSKDRRLWIQDLDGDATRELTWDLADRRAVWFDGTGRLVLAGDRRGALRVWSARGSEPHLLLGHEGGVGPFAVSPDGRWIASGGNDGAVRLWPMPDVSQPPLHTLPHDELIAKLKTLTNLRAVRDPESTTGWAIEAGPFPGWEEVPTWLTPSPEWTERVEAEGDAP
jgi:WD40 repeat protein